MQKVFFDEVLSRLPEGAVAVNVFNLADVEFAILETNGNLSVQKKSQVQPVSLRDLNISTSYQGSSIELVQEGQISVQNLKQVNLDEKWLLNELRTQGITGLKQVVLASLDTEGKLFVDKNKDELEQVTDMSDYPGPN